MPKSQIISAIDIGTTKVTTLIATLNSETDKLNIIGVANEPAKGLRKSQVVDIEEAIESITASVESAERMAGYSISSALATISGGHIESLNSKGVVAVAEPEGEISANDVDRVIEAARAVSLPSSREILHVIPRDFKVDSQEGVKDPVGMSGVRLEAEAHIITGAATAMKNITKCVSEIGVEVDSLVFSGLSSAEAVLTPTEKELGVVLVDIGGGTTAIAVFVEGALSYSSVLPVGAKNITNDLAIGLRVSLTTAEKIKLALSKPPAKDSPEEPDDLDAKTLGVSEEIGKLNRKTLVEGIIRPRLNEIFSMVGEELKKSNLGGATPAGAVVTGGGALSVGLETSCKRTLSLPVRVGYPKGLSGLVDEIKTPAFASSWGLIQYGVKHSRGVKTDSSIKAFGKILGKLPVKGAVNKAVEVIKGFLP
ncbi:MAG: Cell division protein ftsA [Candidatus Beckwithbacteria bacterium GW2011_GWB1_47_15]|uniref:Cell division protein FtsA n=1 Tax=Candidatus Beckwithbacteria bacterium GW2011_GWB1_47_15 TaxID=1618371 RepID=A0A0G1U5S6_9BACT|nr:MAG: cell division protein FtsA, cell division protein FtsA [Candidatus Beckwithbacteria bacterium GW2011_GWC1_49_16]KKU35584.1 MAG: Cell division protein ftsA [Candidatus Beckwithbacteria bacterium GW2011_GWA1_46_30]KKU61638.1 MAG: Cell division protein ftsA [Candidatus Beckwithbacteria bacterium GW2011_GWB1_47_15]KKU72141.1 MAG: Cell division protein ftsA [Candidatus Beckwithbacteria bacterium GW2011_GWA2_47_25]KKW04766.1 MAG: Cell division protein ftsA [Candidatus Beckwithbacteria bacteri